MRSAKSGWADVSRLRPAFAGEDDGSGLPVEYLGDALREVGLG
nr:MAG TPA: hypothetical protein [Caudoviricetes sp.]